jgi:hypothetical protein
MFFLMKSSSNTASRSQELALGYREEFPLLSLSLWFPRRISIAAF